MTFGLSGRPAMAAGEITSLRGFPDNDKGALAKIEINIHGAAVLKSYNK
jgi:hypothetical protein